MVSLGYIQVGSFTILSTYPELFLALLFTLFFTSGMTAIFISVTQTSNNHTSGMIAIFISVTQTSLKIQPVTYFLNIASFDGAPTVMVCCVVVFLTTKKQHFMGWQHSAIPGDDGSQSRLQRLRKDNKGGGTK